MMVFVKLVPQMPPTRLSLFSFRSWEIFQTGDRKEKPFYPINVFYYRTVTTVGSEPEGKWKKKSVG
jgi:hypothetical protein